MADGNGTYGGGGSVKWAVEVEDGDVPAITTKPNPRGYKINSTDKHGSVGSFFEVIIEEPAGGVKMRTEGNRIYLYLPIQSQPAPQITVHWALEALPAGVTSLRNESGS
ncbi:MAG TPA: hypothetical protein VH436_05225 [Vicinamibacterales bacterium]|jgi:hypothetical protein